jgi:GNAT superfamily N-acetyltransferase
VTPERLSRATDEALLALSALCLRSKAHWGYDTAFMAACEDVLRVTQDDLTQPCAVVRAGEDYAGFVLLNLHDSKSELSKLFVCPDHMGKGIGSALITWAKTQARHHAHASLLIESDPQAVPFYEFHGAIQIGDVPSDAIPNRVLPLLKLPTAKA